MMLIRHFPSQEHYEELKAKGFNGRVSDEDKRAWHAYDYGWRRVMLGRREDISPLDPGRQQFNADLADQAELLPRCGRPASRWLKRPSNRWRRS
jgi:hypothetical protein